MEIKERKIKGLYDLNYEIRRDFRGYLAKTFDKNNLILDINFLYEYIQFSHKPNTIRGLHFQLPPYTEAKLVQAINGKVKWVAVDLRKDSPTFGKWDVAILSEKLGNAFYISPGFANGSISLTNKAKVLIKSDKPHMKEFGIGINWKDPELNINWMVKGKPVILDRDDNYPSFNDFKKKTHI